MNIFIVTGDCQSILLARLVIEDLFFLAVLCIILFRAKHARASASDDAHCSWRVCDRLASFPLLYFVLSPQIAFIAVLAFGINLFWTHHHLHLRLRCHGLVKYCLLLFNWKSTLFHLKLLIIQVECLRCWFNFGIQLPGHNNFTWLLFF